MARPYRRALAFLGSGFGRLLDQSRQIGTAAACDPAKQNRVAPRGDCARRQWRCCCSAIRPHRRDEGVNHFSAGHFLTHHSQPDCGGEGTPRLSPCFGRLWGSRGWSPGPQSISPNSDAAVWRLLCREAFHRVMAPSPSFSVASAIPTGARETERTNEEHISGTSDRHSSSEPIRSCGRPRPGLHRQWAQCFEGGGAVSGVLQRAGGSLAGRRIWHLASCR